MAILLSGINGPFSGKVGTVVGYTWKGKAVIRSLPKKRTRPLSPLQLQQHAKFSLMNKFLNPLLSLLNVTYNPVAVQMTGFSKAFSYNVKNAFAASQTGLAINYPMVLLGRGDLPNASSPSAQSLNSGELVFNWTDNTGTGQARATDKLYIAAYCEELNNWIASKTETTRSAGTFTLKLGLFKGKPVQTYIGFITADGKDVSDSAYTGPVNIL
jgi:Family of unknown function (DUF6266)